MPQGHIKLKMQEPEATKSTNRSHRSQQFCINTIDKRKFNKQLLRMNLRVKQN